MYRISTLQKKLILLEYFLALLYWQKRRRRLLFRWQNSATARTRLNVSLFVNFLKTKRTAWLLLKNIISCPKKKSALRKKCRVWEEVLEIASQKTSVRLIAMMSPILKNV